MLLWLIHLPERLPPQVRRLAEDRATRIHVSVVSLWEVLLKLGRGVHLETGGRSALQFLLEQCAAHELEPLPLRPETLAPLERLPALHRDPFDRMLICQAIQEGLVLVTPDEAIRRYPIRTLWD